MGNTTHVDVLTLEDFLRSLDRRRAEAQTMLDTVNNKILNSAPKAGGFPDADIVRDGYATIAGQHQNRLTQLIRAIDAARQATSAIMANYSTTESRNTASPNAIADQLSGVTNALKPNSTGV